MVKEKDLKNDDVEKVTLHFDWIRERVDRAEPHDAEDSRFSTQHVLAYQLVHGDCGLETCTETAVKDPRVAEARKKFNVVYHPEYEKRYFAGEGRIDMELKNGDTVTGGMDQPYGSAKYPLTMDQVVYIYRKYLKGILSEAQIARTTEIILDMENQPDLQELFDICTFRHMAR